MLALAAQWQPPPPRAASPLLGAAVAGALGGAAACAALAAAALLLLRRRRQLARGLRLSADSDGKALPAAHSADLGPDPALPPAHEPSPAAAPPPWPPPDAAACVAAVAAAGGGGMHAAALATGDDFSGFFSPSQQLQAGLAPQRPRPSASAGGAAQPSPLTTATGAGAGPPVSSGGGGGSSAEQASSAERQLSNDISAMMRRYQTTEPSREGGVAGERLLGRGAYGMVYLGSWRGLPVAVKLVLLSAADSAGRRERLAREVALTSSLLHPNIVPTYHHTITPLAAPVPGPLGQQRQGSDSGAPPPGSGGGGECAVFSLRIVMQYCEGGTLREALKAGVFAEPRPRPRATAEAPASSPSAPAAPSTRAAAAAGAQLPAAPPAATAAGGNAPAGAAAPAATGAGAGSPEALAAAGHAGGGREAGQEAAGAAAPPAGAQAAAAAGAGSGEASARRLALGWGNLRPAAHMPLALLAALDVARGLAYLHGAGVVHGDLNDNNVLIKHATPALALRAAAAAAQQRGRLRSCGGRGTAMARAESCPGGGASSRPPLAGELRGRPASHEPPPATPHVPSAPAPQAQPAQRAPALSPQSAAAAASPQTQTQAQALPLPAAPAAPPQAQPAQAQPGAQAAVSPQTSQAQTVRLPDPGAMRILPQAASPEVQPGDDKESMQHESAGRGPTALPLATPPSLSAPLPVRKLKPQQPLKPALDSQPPVQSQTPAQPPPAPTAAQHGTAGCRAQALLPPSPRSQHLKAGELHSAGSPTDVNAGLSGSPSTSGEAGSGASGVGARSAGPTEAAGGTSSVEGATGLGVQGLDPLGVQGLDPVSGATDSGSRGGTAGEGGADAGGCEADGSGIGADRGSGGLVDTRAGSGDGGGVGNFGSGGEGVGAGNFGSGGEGVGAAEAAASEQQWGAAGGYCSTSSVEPDGEAGPGAEVEGEVEERAAWLLQRVFKISDFGLAVRMDRPDQTHVSNMNQGTPYFVAPEVLRAGRLSPAADIYSFGVMAWGLLHGISIVDLRHLLPGAFTPLGRLLARRASPGLPPRCRALLARCLGPEPAGRPGAGEVEAELRAALEEAAGPELAAALLAAERREHTPQQL